MSKTPKQLAATRIFISYHRKESSDFVKRLSRDLAYILQDEKATWYDELMSANKDWLLEITRQLAVRKVFILILTPGALKSPYVRDEIQMAWMRKNAKTSAKKTFIILHLVESRNKISHDLQFLNIPQWIECLPSKSYPAILTELFKAINIPINDRADELFNTLDKLELKSLVRPKADADFSIEEREEHLNVLGKYVVVCIRQAHWDDVLTCADEALALKPNDEHWLHMKQQALENLSLSVKTNNSRPSNEQMSDSSGIIKNNTDPRILRTDDPRFTTSQNEIPITKNTHNSSPIEHPSPSNFIKNGSTRNAEPRSRRKAHSKKSNNYTMHKVTNGTSDQINHSPSYKVNKQNYLTKFCVFILDIISVNKTTFLVSCIMDMLFPFIISFLLYFYYWQTFTATFILSFIALSIGPITKNRRKAAIASTFFGLSWAIVGWLIGWGISRLINQSYLTITKSMLHLNYVLFSTTISVTFFLFSILLHFIIIYRTNYLVSE